MPREDCKRPRIEGSRGEERVLFPLSLSWKMGGELFHEKKALKNRLLFSLSSHRRHIRRL